MYEQFKKSLMLGAFTALLAAPSFAQVSLDVGPLHVRVVPEAPPPVRYEHRPPRPHSDYIWIGGYWDRRGDRWEWVDGRWEQPRGRSYTWVKPRYTREGQYWRYDPGHWSNERLNDEEYRRWHSDNSHNGHER